MAIQLQVLLVHVHGSSRYFLQFLGAPDVVDVRVSNHNGFHAKIVTRQDSQYLVDLITRIHHDGLVGTLIAKDGAVTLQHSYGQDLMNHMKNQYNMLKG